LLFNEYRGKGKDRGHPFLVTQNSKMIDHTPFTAGDLIKFPTTKAFSVVKLRAGLNIRTIAPAMIARVVATGSYMPDSADSFITLTGASNTHRPLPNWTAGALMGAATEGLS
jgi:hypothetical protein